MRKVHRTNINTECLTSQSSFYEAVFTFRDKCFHYKGLAVFFAKTRTLVRCLIWDSRWKRNLVIVFNVVFIPAKFGGEIA